MRECVHPEGLKRGSVVLSILISLRVQGGLSPAAPSLCRAAGMQACGQESRRDWVYSWEAVCVFSDRLGLSLDLASMGRMLL